MPRKQQKLTDEQLEHLAELICQGQDSASEVRSQALLVLMDEIERHYGAEDIAPVVKSMAFPRCGDDHIASYVQFLRSEVFQ